jgi:hypothetical protein
MKQITDLHSVLRSYTSFPHVPSWCVQRKPNCLHFYIICVISTYLHTYIHTYIYVCVRAYVRSLLCMHVYNMSIPHMLKYKSFIVTVTIKFCWVSHKFVCLFVCLFVHPFSYICNIGHVNYRLQFTTQFIVYRHQHNTIY